MIATARAKLVTAFPGLARFVGGFYPHLPVRLCGFTLSQNHEALVVWTSSDATVRCERRSADWHVSVSSPHLEREVQFTEFNKALSKAYSFICFASPESDLEPVRESP